MIIVGSLLLIHGSGVIVSFIGVLRSVFDVVLGFWLAIMIIRSGKL